MDITHTIQPDLARLARNLTHNVKGARRAGMIHIIAEVEALAVKKVPVKTSNLANSHTGNVNADGSEGTVSFIAPYAGYVHEGTGLYGPHKQKIVPKSKKALYWPGAAHPVRAVTGMRARPFLKRAAEGSNMEALFAEGANNYLQKQG